MLPLQQYWAGDPDAYAFIGISQLAQAFKDSGISTDHCEEDKGGDLEAGRKARAGAGQALKKRLRKRSSNSSRETAQGEEGAAPDEDLDPLVHDK